MRTAAEIRRTFIDYFKLKAKHTEVPSSPVVPLDDPTLLFTNAGMNQFKDVFLGRGTRDYTRAVDTQKCIRAGGKHNDLEDVGRDVYHHTFFEMLGNWSFGDYFKKESIEWAWDLLTNVYGLPKDRLYATYFEGNAQAGLQPDLEARDLWLQYLPADRVLPGNMKDNFWEMGETGPCGPCSEIHFDRIGGRDASMQVNSGDPDVLEIWNLVFIQFNREVGGVLRPLPAKHVDTGMGFERLVSVLQDKRSNYETDLWLPLFAAIQQATGAKPYGGVLEDNADISYRVIADHVRCLSSAIADGAAPGSDGRNYVLRRILRRAARMGHQYLAAKGPFIHAVVPAVVQSLGEVFPELRTQGARIASVILNEEIAFGRTLERGLELFAQAAHRAAGNNNTMTAQDAFSLHDTMGFPIDLTEVMALERGLRVDEAGYEALMETARYISRAGGVAEHRITLTPDAIEKLKTLGVKPTDIYPKYAARAVTSCVEAIWDGQHLQQHAESGTLVAVITRRSCFHAEGGGQVADTGRIVADHPGATLSCAMSDVDRMVGGVHSAAENTLGLILDGQSSGGARDRHDAVEFTVESVFDEAGFVLHIGRVTRGRLNCGDRVIMDLARGHRKHVAAHHTCTHLLNWALREVLGDEVQQRGSLVADDRLRFDFSFGRAMTHDEIAKVEQLVQGAIAGNLKVDAVDAPLAQAKSIVGVRAVFGEKYPDPVRVVSIGATVAELLANPSNPAWRACSVEFCGGTHLAESGETKKFALLGEGALSAGVRRMQALAGVPAQAAYAAAEKLHERLLAAHHLQGDAMIEEAAAITTASQELTLPASARHALQAPLEALRAQSKNARRQGEAAGRLAAVAAMHALLAQAQGFILIAKIDDADAAALMAALDVAKSKVPDTAVLLVSADAANGKVSIAARVPQALIAKGLKAGDWVKGTAQACGGSGGGKPDLAQAGGNDAAKIGEALDAARVLAAKCV